MHTNIRNFCTSSIRNKATATEFCCNFYFSMIPQAETSNEVWNRPLITITLLFKRLVQLYNHLVFHLNRIRYPLFCHCELLVHLMRSITKHKGILNIVVSENRSIVTLFTLVNELLCILTNYCAKFILSPRRHVDNIPKLECCNFGE